MTMCSFQSVKFVTAYHVVMLICKSLEQCVTVPKKTRNFIFELL